MTVRWHRMSPAERKAVRGAAKFQADRRRGLVFAAEDLCPKCHRLLCVCGDYEAKMAAIHEECRQMSEPKRSWWRKLVGR